MQYSCNKLFELVLLKYFVLNFTEGHFFLSNNNITITKKWFLDDDKRNIVSSGTGVLVNPSVVQGPVSVAVCTPNRPLARYVNLRVAHAPGMPGTFSPPPTS